MASHRPSRPSATPLPAHWERDLTEQFRQRLSTKRMRELSSRPSSRSPAPHGMRTASPAPQTQDHHHTLRHGSGGNACSRSPANIDTFSLGAQPNAAVQTSSLANIPLIPSPPADSSSRQFRNQLHMLSEVPRKWENPGLLDEAMRAVPLERIYAEATDEAETLKATADSLGKKPAWAYQDCVIRALLKWFKAEFFKWVNNPPCSRCGSPTVAKGDIAPTPDERACGGNRVELYQCSQPSCAAKERFPRYTDAFVLMRTRQGRLGEWVNCFGMLCRAMGARVRWVWNSEDHVWTEVYSEYRRRWVHVDPCESQFDKPLMYNEGWGKKLAYCIAFSADGAVDVTRRYCRNPAKYALERSKCSESSLLYILDEIRQLRRRDAPKDEKFRLEGEDMRETRELRHYFVSAITAEVARLVPRKGASGAREMTATEMADARKAAESREHREHLDDEQRARGTQGQDQQPRHPDGRPPHR